MRKANETRLNSGIYARINDLPMSEADRQLAVNAMRDAEQLAEFMLWIKSRIAALGNLVLRPSLKH